MSGSGDMDFCRLFPNFLYNLRKGPKITRLANMFSGNNLVHLEDTLGDPEPQLEFYHRNVIGGFPRGPAIYAEGFTLL